MSTFNKKTLIMIEKRQNRIESKINDLTWDYYEFAKEIIIKTCDENNWDIYNDYTTIIVPRGTAYEKRFEVENIEDYDINRLISANRELFNVDMLDFVYIDGVWEDACE